MDFGEPHNTLEVATEGSRAGAALYMKPLDIVSLPAISAISAQ